MKLKKFLISVILTIVMIPVTIVLAGCSPSGTPPVNNDNEPLTGPDWVPEFNPQNPIVGNWRAEFQGGIYYWSIWANGELWFASYYAGGWENNNKDGWKINHQGEFVTIPYYYVQSFALTGTFSFSNNYNTMTMLLATEDPYDNEIHTIVFARVNYWPNIPKDDNGAGGVTIVIPCPECGKDLRICGEDYGNIPHVCDCGWVYQPGPGQGFFCPTCDTTNPAYCRCHDYDKLDIDG